MAVGVGYGGVGYGDAVDAAPESFSMALADLQSVICVLLIVNWLGFLRGICPCRSVGYVYLVEGGVG